MSIYIDQIGSQVEIKQKPTRIISLVPSQTELLHYLGINDEVVGITKFCVHPTEWFRSKARIGGTKTVDIKKIRDFAPDLIIANKEENVQEQVEELSKNFPVWISDINTLPDAFEMIEEVGKITGRTQPAKELVNKIEQSLLELTTLNLLRKTRAGYLIWKNPYMSVGGDTFISEMLKALGVENIFQNKHRYPQVTIDDLKECELLLLSSEPYPFKQNDIDELKAVLPNTQIMLVDGELFSWYGSRLLHSASYFKQLRRDISSLL